MRTLNDFDRVINDLAVSANTDIVPIIQPSRPAGGYFGVPRMVFCYVNFLGLLYSGWRGEKYKRGTKKGEKRDFGTSGQAKKYIKEVMGKVDKLYKRHAGLLYDVYRHGTVHIYSPKKMASRVKPKTTIEWLIYKGDRESWQYYENKAIKLRHLEVIEWSKDRFVVPLSINILYDDLFESMILYRRMVHEDKSSDLLKNFSSVAEALDKEYDPTPYDFWSGAKKLE